MCADVFVGGGDLKERKKIPDLHADGSITQKWVSNKLVGRRGQTSVWFSISTNIKRWTVVINVMSHRVS
jgi:hypothetical protein